MSLNPKNNIIKALWEKRFTFWWIVSFIEIIGFDLFWMGQTTFRPMSLFPFWAYLLLSATLLASPVLFERKGWLNTLVLLFANVVMIANLMYCTTYYAAIPLRSYMLAGNLADFGGSVANAFRWYYASLPLFSLLSFIVYRFLFAGRKERRNPYKYNYGNNSKTKRIAGLCVWICIFAVFAWAVDISAGGAKSRMNTMKESPYEASCILPVYTIPGFLIFDYVKNNETLSAEQKGEVEDWLASHKELADYITSDTIKYDRGKVKKNLLIILCESLESWPLEKEIEGIEVTPYLNSLLKDSTTFYAPKVVSRVGSGRSIDAQLLILAGMIPMRNNVYAYDAIGNQYYTLPKAMKEKKGAAAYLLTCDKPYVWNQARVAEAFGMDTIISAEDFVRNETVGPRRRLSDGSFMRQSTDKLKNGEIWSEGENAFILWVTYSGHNPFVLPENLRRVEFKGDYPEIIKNYLVTANYTDNSLSTLIEYLKTRKDWAETLVVITGDHEGLASDRQTALENPLSRQFVDSIQHTPLIILNAGQGGRFEREMSEVDIYPTLLELMNLDDYEWKGLGLPVLSDRFPGVAFSSTEELTGDTIGKSSVTIDHLQAAGKISDRILRFNLLSK